MSGADDRPTAKRPPDGRGRTRTQLPDGRGRTRTRPPDDRGQTFTLEAVVAAVLLIASIAFALQVTGVTSQSASTGSDHVSNQHGELAAGVLDAAAANDTLRGTVLYWNLDEGSFHGANRLGYYEDDGPPTAFWRTVAAALDERGLAVNVNVHYVAGGTVERKRVVYRGEPSDEAGRASVTLTLTDDDRLYAADGTLTNVTLAEAADAPQSFYAPDASAGATYNVVRVEVVVWRV